MRVYTSKPMAERLAKIVEIPFCGCWLWMGSLDRDGYGRMIGSADGVRVFEFAHRASYKFHVGPIPPGKMVLHRCDTPCCINPHHLYVGTQVENGRDKKVRGRARTTPSPGRLNGMYGRTGDANPMFGKTHTEEALAKMRGPRKAQK